MLRRADEMSHEYTYGWQSWVERTQGSFEPHLFTAVHPPVFRPAPMDRQASGRRANPKAGPVTKGVDPNPQLSIIITRPCPIPLTPSSPPCRKPKVASAPCLVVDIPALPSRATPSAHGKGVGGGGPAWVRLSCTVPSPTSMITGPIHY